MACAFPSYAMGGPFLVFAQLPLAGLACILDWHISDTLRHNVDRIVAHGLAPTRFHVFCDIGLELITSQCLSVSLAVMSGWYEAESNYDWFLVRNVVLCLGLTEVVFTLIHQYFLHGTRLGSMIHELHHTCRPTSFTTTFLFHFWDSFAEFMLPLLVMAIFGIRILEDPFALYYGLQIANLWYSVGDHSEHLKLGHYWHHQHINSNYSVYSNLPSKLLFKKKPSKDYARELVFGKVRKLKQRKELL